ncbi:MAG: FAD-dependent 5-carboxymethylaminomethyl-2-thiouridine(34) oxidoreductase MnmC [Acidobacteria bacterium]|nr:FAD-dependent 5-carboxymethylaminomethyl-2-thiouridine(34) oxidoreductase MnmC [Acidobacteriota bacterium]
MTDAIVIGSGIAGASAASALAARGVQVLVLERQPAVAQGASGNPIGLVHPYYSAKPSPMSEFLGVSYAFNQAWIRSIKGFKGWKTAPIYQFLSSLRHQKQYAEMDRNPGDFPWIKLGAVAGHPGFYYRHAYAVQPAALCNALLAQNGIQTRLAWCVSKVEWIDSVWHVSDENGRTESAQHLILANAGEASALLPELQAHLYPNKGQLCWFAAKDSEIDPSFGYCYEGYLTPVMAGIRVLGATFDRDFSHLHSDPQVPGELARLTQNWLPQFQLPSPVQNRVSVRSTTRDRLPLVGPMPTYQNVWLSLGHGSRGLLSGPMAGEILARSILGLPNLDPRILRWVLPQRLKMAPRSLLPAEMRDATPISGG